MQSSTNYGFNKPDLTDAPPDITAVSDAIEAIDGEIKTVETAAAAKIPNSLATAASQFLVSSAAGIWAVKTVAQIKTLLGLGSAAYTASTAYATAAQGTLAANAAPASELTAHKADLASRTTLGHVQLQTAVDTSESKALTPKALNSHLSDLTSHGEVLSLYRSGKDANGVFTTLWWKRSDATLAKQSVLSGGISPKYTTRTVTYYALDGTTVTLTKVYTETYTGDDLTSEVLQ